MSLLLLCAMIPLGVASPAAPSLDLERAARVLSARDARSRGVGGWVPPAKGVTLDGAPAGWRDEAGEKGVVIAFVSLTCPVGRKLFPELARAETVARGLGLGFVHVGVEGLDDAKALRAHAEVQGLKGLVLQDGKGAIGAALGVQTTTEVFVIDARGSLCYRGAVTDQYGIGFELPAPRRRFLDDAMRAVAEEREIEVPATSAPGCAVEPPSPAGEVPAESSAGSPLEESIGDVTYARDISRLMQASCIECHHGGGVAPFALDSYQTVSRRASMLLDVIDEGLMPPWFAAHAEAGSSPWSNDRSLLPGERDLLARWIEAGKPMGDPSELPRPRSLGAAGAAGPGEAVEAQLSWALGEPDLVFELPRAFDVPAEGRIDYHYASVPTGLLEDTWVRAIEVRPGAVDVVHHVLAYALPADAYEGGRLRRWDLIDERRGFFAAWAPGAEPAVYPEGHARLLEAGTVLLLELHYTPNGTPRKDRSAIGIHLASPDPEWRPDHVVRTAGISNRSFQIPAGESAYVADATGVITRDMRVTSFMPHMHLRGQSFIFERVGLKGGRTTLLNVPRYDFNWQLAYTLSDPLRFTAGERIDVRALFDNSSANLANPDPKRRVGWGPETDDEMLIGFIDYVLVVEDLKLPAGEPQLVVLEPRVQSYLKKIAAESGGAVPRSRLPRDSHASFDKLDLNGDGVLKASELTILNE